MLQSCIRMVNFTTFYSYQSCNQFCGNNRFFDEMQQHNYLFLRRFCDISLSFRYEISRHIYRKRAGVFRQLDLAGHPFGNRYGYSNMIWGHQLFLMIHLIISSLFFSTKAVFSHDTWTFLALFVFVFNEPLRHFQTCFSFFFSRWGGEKKKKKKMDFFKQDIGMFQAVNKTLFLTLGQPWDISSHLLVNKTQYFWWYIMTTSSQVSANKTWSF